MKALQELNRIWPVMDGSDRETLLDFFERWTHSWVTYSGGMSESAKGELVKKLEEQLEQKARILREDYADELSRSAPKSQESGPLSLPPEVTRS